MFSFLNLLVSESNQLELDLSIKEPVASFVFVAVYIRYMKRMVNVEGPVVATPQIPFSARLLP